MPTSLVWQFEDFTDATRGVLKDLHERHGMALWMFTRTVDDDWVVLEAEDHGYEIHRGDVFRWSDTFCIHMVAGEGPRAAPVAEEVDVYAAAPIGRQIDIGAYVGVPLLDSEGRLFGTLCAIDPAPRQDCDLEAVADEVEILGSLLMTLMRIERELRSQRSASERILSEARIDELTGVPNRRGWEELVEREESRCDRYGDPAGVMIVDLDDLKLTNDTHGHAAGDELLKLTAQTLSASVRQMDVVARIGGDEFGVLATATEPSELDSLAGRIESALGKVGVRASVGWALREPAGGLRAAQEQAGEAMYAIKRDRRQGTDQAGRDGSAGL